MDDSSQGGNRQEGKERWWDGSLIGRMIDRWDSMVSQERIVVIAFDIFYILPNILFWIVNIIIDGLCGVVCCWMCVILVLIGPLVIMSYHIISYMSVCFAFELLLLTTPRCCGRPHVPLSSYLSRPVMSLSFSFYAAYLSS